MTSEPKTQPKVDFKNESFLRFTKIQTSYIQILVGLTVLTFFALGFWHVVMSAITKDTFKKPNIILIVGDDIGYNDVGYARFRKGFSWKAPVPYTPNLDRLAHEGVKLESNYLSPTCTPSRAALHTGRYPHKIGTIGIIEMNKPTGVRLNERFLPQYLKFLGYDTHLVGKWHLGYCKWEYTPTERGYDSFLGYHGGAEYYYSHNNIVTFKNRRMDGYDFWFNKRVHHSLKYSTYEFGNRTVELIKDAKKKGNPFFINLSFQAAHAPLEVPEEYVKLYENLKVPLDRKRFMGIMTAMDEQIGKIVNVLKETDQWSNTVVIFTSDNGGKPSRGGNNYPLRGTKTTLWEGGTRVPAFIVGKDIPSGQAYKGLFHITDWLPTILHMAGGRITAGYDIDGMSHFESIKNEASSPRTEFIYQINPLVQRMGIRVGDWKLLVGNPGRHNNWYGKPNDIEDSKIWTKNPMEMHLFNIKDDPDERVNVTLKYPLIAKKLYERLLEHKEDVADIKEVDGVMRANPNKTGGVWMPGWC